MVFSKFFKPKGEAAPGAANEDDVTPLGDGDAEDDEAGATPEEWHEPSLSERAAAIMPTGASTGSKRPDALYGEHEVDEPIGPTHYVRADGCHIEAAGGVTLVDCTMALGAVALGYGDPMVTRAAMEATGLGNVAGLPHTLEVEVAERVADVIPCAERIQFLKTGAEAVAAAVRIARTYTARDVVIGSGYFGWHDWNSPGAGVPANVSANYVAVPFNDVAALAAAADAAGPKLAAVVMEPVVEALASAEWMQAARAACDKHGAVLVFDEVKTGFRLATGGYQQFADVTPDLAAFGKAMSNGYPLAAVCGRADVMEAARKTWISSTLASEATALAAALAVTEIHRERDVCAELAGIGAEMRRVVDGALAASGLAGVALRGIDPMWFLHFDDPASETFFVRIAVQHGVLFKRGAYNFPSLAHDDDAIRAIESAASNAFIALRNRRDA